MRLSAGTCSSEKPLRVPHPRPDETCKESPQTTAQSREHLVTGDELYFAAVNLADAAFNLEPPSLFNIWGGRTVQRLNEGKGEVRALGVGQLGRLFLQFREHVGHGIFTLSSDKRLYVAPSAACLAR